MALERDLPNWWKKWIVLLIIVTDCVVAKVQIIDLSLTLGSYSRAQGSYMGGTIIYLRGSGFSAQATSNSILIGPYPCHLLADGSTQTLLACETTEATDPSKTYDLPVSVSVNSEPSVTCSTSVCRFRYLSSKTPFIEEVWPANVVGETLISSMGIHRISDIGDGRSDGEGQVMYMLVGENLCSRIDLIEDDINANARKQLSCKVFKQQVAGEYLFTQRVDPGFARKSVRLLKESRFTDQSYEMRVLPNILTMSANSGGNKGHRLQVTGTGFVTDASRYECQIAGQVCQVTAATATKLTIQVPQHTVSNTEFGALPQDASDLNTQIDKFILGLGALYTRYTRNTDMSLDQWLPFLRGSHSLTVEEQMIITELSSPEVTGANTLEYIRGYLRVYTPGTYEFYGLSDDKFIMQMSTVINSANPQNLEIIMEQHTHTSSQFNPFINGGETNNRITKNLVAGYYYYELLGINYGGPGFFKVMMQTPATTSPANPTWEIQEILIAPSGFQAEIIVVEVYGQSGDMRLYYSEINGADISLHNAIIGIGSTAAQFRSGLSALPNIINYGPTVGMETLDINGDVIADPALVEGYRYTITIDRYRPDTTLPLLDQQSIVAGTAPVSLTIERTQQHSPPLSATFRMSVGSTDVEINGVTDLPYTVSVSSLTSFFKSHYAVEEILVYQTMHTHRQDVLHLIIQYVGLEQNPQDITIDVSAMGGSPTVTQNTLMEYSATKPFYNPIPVDFLYVPSATPSLTLSIDSIPSVCSGDCSYEIIDALTASVTAATYSSPLTSTITNINQQTLSQLTISLLGASCSTVTGTTDAPVCTFPVNDDSSDRLPAGNQVPVYHFDTIGYADTSALTPISIPITASISPSSSSPGGGLLATISGTGFPTSLSETSVMTVLLCGIEVTSFISVANQEITFIIPPGQCSPGASSSITVNGVATSLTFNYDPSLSPTISSISPQSSSPILKSTIIITGTAFVDSQTKIYLIDRASLQKRYELNPISITNTEINCVLGGGRTGDYYVSVVVEGAGATDNSPTAQFAYKIVVSSITTTSNSEGGGYTMTITGSNFVADITSHHVFIGDAINALCPITSITTTTIQCTVPRSHDSYSSGDDLEVVVTGRIIEESVCEGTCTFAYNSADNTVVDQLVTTTYLPGEAVTITGTSLLTGSVAVGGITVTPTQQTDTQVDFEYPALARGTYEIFITVDGANTHPQLLTSTPLSINSLEVTSGSTQGIRNKIIGVGFPTSSQIDLEYICNSIPIDLEIITLTAEEIQFDIPPQVSGNCEVKIIIEQLERQFTYNYDSSRTPTIDIVQTSTDLYTLTITSSELAAQITTAFFTYQETDLSAYEMTIAISGDPASAQMATLTPSGGYLPSGIELNVMVGFDGKGYAASSPSTVSKTFSAAPSILASLTDNSFAGGNQMQILGAGFITDQKQNNVIYVCGVRATVYNVDQSSITIYIPPLVTQQTQATYQIAAVGKVEGSVSSDIGSAEVVFDGNINTIYSSSNSECWIEVDFGDGQEADLDRIRYFPNPDWAVAGQYLEGALFQVSNDGITYVQLMEVDVTTVHAGWNTWARQSGDSHIYRYVRFIHTSLSSCQLAEIQIYGIIYSTEDVGMGNKVCDLTIEASQTTIPSSVTYSHTSTARISSSSPSFGTTGGGTTILFTGTNIEEPATVTIDGISCQIQSTTSMSIECISGARVSPPSQGNSLVILSNGNTAINAVLFLYVDRWSEEATWGGQALPRQGDSVYVPKGMTLLVDESTPVLDSVIVEGKIQFADENDMTFDAHYFIINEGQFQVGTEATPYEHQLTFTMHGGYYDKQLPMFGNKVIGCRNCIFNMHGIERNPTWTQVSSTIQVGDTSFTVITAVDWEQGESIAIAATSFDHYETEQKIIESVSGDGLTITVTTPFVYRHFAAAESYGSDEIVMRAEVGLLSRNVKMQGAENSIEDKYGSHLMLTGSQEEGFVGKLSYVEFTACGQPKIVGRYCTHYHMVGDVPESYVRGIAVHHSVARVLTIHGTHFLLVQKNVGYHVQGHNIFVEDGIETNNVIQDNLMMSSISSLLMLQSDITVASYWITNPSNHVRRNHAGGGEFYGFWYEIKEHPDGPSATGDICPMGMLLGESKENVAHSNIRFGLRIFKLSARKYPCLPTKNQNLLDPYSDNPAFQSVFENYTLWRNEECGFLGEELGYTTVRNIKTVDSRKGGLQFHKTNYTLEQVVAENSLVVGFSSGNAPDDPASLYANGRGIIVSRTDGLKISGVKFHNFATTMTPWQSCSECYHFKLWVTGSKTTLVQNVEYNGIEGNYIFWENWRREIFIDLDGTMTQPLKDLITPPIPDQSPVSITPFRPSLVIPDHCFEVGGATWDESIFCDDTITLRSILFTNMLPYSDFKATQIKVFRLDTAYEDISSFSVDDFSVEEEVKIKSGDIKNSWAMPFASGYYYNVHWKWGIDFQHLALAPSRLWAIGEGVVLRFNYSAARQLFQIAPWYEAALQLPFVLSSATLVEPDTCMNGDNYHDEDEELLFVCISGRDKQVHEWVNVNGITCRNNCPDNPLAEGVREDFERVWSNVSQWPTGLLPRQGENVTIPYEWKIRLDVDPPILYYLEVNGILIFDEARDNKLQAHYIWVLHGIIRIGESQNRFDRNADIVLHGEKDDPFLVVDADAAGNKIMVVTGGLEFYGATPNTIWTRLTAIAPVGTTSITVVEADGWVVGDRIVIAPSYAGRAEYEQVTILGIAGNTITFSPALNYEHYGSSTTTIQNEFGILDARSAVGHISRHIKISSGFDVNGWGCRMLIYANILIPDDPNLSAYFKSGYARLIGVQFDGCSQYDTSAAALRVEKINSNAFYPSEQHTVISESCIHSCKGYCTWIGEVSNVTFTNNVLVEGKKFLVYVEEVYENYHFTHNLLIGALRRPEVSTQFFIDDVASYQHYFPINFSSTSNISVTHNLAQGSEGQGFVFPATPCSLLPVYPFVHNTAGSCETAFMYEKVDGQQCLGASKIVAYASEIGLMANFIPSPTSIIYQQMFFADNERGITLRYAHETDDNRATLRNSYFVGFSRPDCPSCYSASTISYCNGGYAVRMLSVTITGEKFPLVKAAAGHDVICTRQSFDFKAFLYNVVFENYLHSNPTLPFCSNMKVFRRHSGASDGTGSHHLLNTRCINCEKESWAYFDPPSASWKGWFGGCGELDCTGPNNYIIFDQDGDFTGEISQLLANNSWVGEGEDECEFVEDMNGYWCHFDKLAVLQYESIAPDFNKRIMWPVYLKYDGGRWESQTNAWRQWQWNGPEPLNLRLARFWSVVKLYQNYNLTYSSQPPSDSRFQIQQRLEPSGNPHDWLIIRMYFPVPNSVEVLVKNTSGTDIVIKPFTIKKGISVDLRSHTDFCGANNFFYENSTIQFLVNGKEKCQVRVRLTNFVQLSVRIQIPIDDFYTNNGETTFLTNMIAFLGIDYGRLKIVGVRSGSTLVDTHVQLEGEELATSTQAAYDPAAEYMEINRIKTLLEQGLTAGEIYLGGSILEYNVYQKVFNLDATEFSSDGNRFFIQQSPFSEPQGSVSVSSEKPIKMYAKAEHTGGTGMKIKFRVVRENEL